MGFQTGSKNRIPFETVTKTTVCGLSRFTTWISKFLMLQILLSERLLRHAKGVASAVNAVP